MSRYEKFDEETRHWLKAAVNLARKSGASELLPEHLFSALADVGKRDSLSHLFDCNHVTLNADAVEKLKATNESSTERIGERSPDSKLSPSDSARRLFTIAESFADSSKVRPLHLLHALWQERPETFTSIITPKNGTELKPLDDWEDPNTVAPSPSPSSSPATYEWLSKLGREISPPADAPPIIGREQEVAAVVATLLKYYKPNPILVGEAGVGKTAIVEGLAVRIRDGEVPEQLQGMRIFELRVSELIAGTGLHGSLEERLKNVLDEAEGAPDVILFFDEIHTLLNNKL